MTSLIGCHNSQSKANHIENPFKLSDKLAELPETSLTMILIMDEEKVNFGSHENLNVIVQNDIEPVDVEMVKFDVPLTRTAGSVPIKASFILGG